MKKEFIIIGVVAFVILTLFFVFDPIKGSISGNAIQETSKYETKYSESTVIVDLTPKEIRNGLFHIDIGVNTHTVDLEEYNLQELITLEYSGRTIKPKSSPSLKGHHNYGELVFDIGDDNIESFIIKVRDLPDIRERIFEW